MASILPTSAEKQDRLGLLSQSVKRAFIAGSPTLHKIEKRISSCLSSEASQLTEISGYLLRLGGKRVRPLMTTMTSRLCGMSTATPALIDAAAGIELIHMATLLHDDIIDKSITRRSQPSAYSKYGLASTLLTGDFLLVKAFGLCARLDRFVIEATENACIELTEGEVLEGRITANRQIDFDDYVTIIKKKTASLFTLYKNRRPFGWSPGRANRSSRKIRRKCRDCLSDG